MKKLKVNDSGLEEIKKQIKNINRQLPSYPINNDEKTIQTIIDQFNEQVLYFKLEKPFVEIGRILNKDVARISLNMSHFSKE